jgi:hypothetical protein
VYMILFDLTDGEGWSVLVMRRWVGLPGDREGFLSRQGQGIKEGLHGGLSEAPFALMRPDLVERAHRGVEVGLQVVDLGAARSFCDVLDRR